MNLRAVMGLLLLWHLMCSCAMGDSAVGLQYCSSNSDCPTGFSCDLDYRVCTRPDPAKSIVDFELSPENGTGSSLTQIPGLDLDRLGDTIELELNKAVAFTGQVKRAVGVPGSIVATRKPEFDSRALSWNFQVGSDGYFDTWVAWKDSDIASNVMDVLFRPSNRDETPQLFAKNLQVSQQGLDAFLVYPDYPAPEQIAEQTQLFCVKLRVLQSENFPHPLTGMVVEALTDQGLRTNLGVPDEQGNVFLKLPVTILADDGDGMVFPKSLSIIIRPTDSNVRLPSVQYDDVSLQELDPSSPDLGTFYTGDVPDVRSVSGLVLSRSGQPVGNCQLRFSALGIGNGTYQITLEADAEGAFSTTLPEGHYTVLAVAGLEHDVGLRAQELDVGLDTGSVSVVLDSRLRLSGRVVDPDGYGVAQAVVRASRVTDWNGVDDGVSRSFDTMCDDQGRFELRVDTGNYDLSIVPPTSSGLPRLALNKVLVSTDDVDLPTTSTTLPHAEVIKGHVFNHAGSPMCSVTIDAYSSDEKSSVLIGQGVSGTGSDSCNGAYSVVVPAGN